MKPIIYLFAILLAIGCSGADPNNANLLSLAKSKDERTDNFLNTNYKTAGVYLDYGAALIVTVIYKDLEYRKLLHQELSRQYFLEKDIREELWRDRIQEYQNFFEFLVIVYSRDNRKVDFGDKHSQWQAFLWDNEGDKLVPSAIVKVSDKSKEKIFLDKYLYPLDRWSQLYRVSFPKHNRLDADKKKPFRLVVSGIKGQAVLTWPTPALFYQNPKEFKASL